MQRKVMVAGAAALLLLICLGSASHARSGPHPTETIATVNGRPVSVGEFAMAADAHRHTVFRYYLDRTGALSAGSTFWDTAVDGAKPRDRLKQLAIDAIAKAKIEQQWAIELGLRQDQSYGDFLKALRDENEMRQAKVARGEAIYGPQQFDEQGYADYVHSKLLVQLKNTLSNRWDPDDATLRAEYARHQASYRYPDASLVESIDLPLSMPDAQARLALARAHVLSGRAFGEVAKEIRTADSGSFELVLDPMLRSQGNASHRVLLEEIDGLPAGSVSRVITLDDRAYLLRFVGRKDGGAQPFAEAKDALKDHWTNRRMEQEIEKRAKAAAITFRDDVFERLSAEKQEVSM